jgi:selenocysteine lyase/cysteine desulfurase
MAALHETPLSRRRPRAADRGFAAAESAFLRAYPVYASTSVLDTLRAREYGRLDAERHTYLDFTGGGLYAASQVRDHLALLRRTVLGNPHSSNPTSLAATKLVEEARETVLRFFNASPEEYVVIFTANASAALKLVGESYPFGPGSRYLLTYDNHNSVNGIREFARARGAEVTYVPVLPPELRIDTQCLDACLDRAVQGGNNLFAYPAQSNFSGVQHDLEWIDRAHAGGWDVVLDAAAYAPANRLDLSSHHPDFVPLSFYKMFGYPTGVGCLLARRATLSRLRRPWFSGGAVTAVSVVADAHQLADGEAAFEDGTVNYLSLPAVTIGLEHLTAIGMDTIHKRVICLTGWLLDALAALRHTNGTALVRILGPADTERRGGTMTLVLSDPSGAVHDYEAIEQLANAAFISLRTGCFCNPGADEMAHGLTAADFGEVFQRDERITVEELRAALAARGRTVGGVRVSLGLVTTFADVYRFVQFTRGLLNRSVAEVSAQASATCRRGTQTAW